jgi:hypothetical protein
MKISIRLPAMKRRPFTLCLLGALLLPASIILFRPAGNPSLDAEKPASPAAAKPPAPAESPAAPAPPQAETIRRFVQSFEAWETASGSAGDRLEEQLRDAITDENAGTLLRALPPRFHGTYVGNLLLTRWAAQDRGAAIHWLVAQTKPSLFEVNAVTKNWSVQDTDGLERYVDDLPPSPWKNLVLESTGRDALMHKDAELAFSLLQGMDDNPAKIPLLANAAQQWAQWDPRSAVEEINKLPDPAARERLILAVASGYALANPDAAADWLRQSFPEGATLDRGLAGVVQAWTSAGDPASAARWVTKLPAGSTRDRALRELIAAWNEESPDALKNWLSTLPEGGLRAQADAALGTLASLP